MVGLLGKNPLNMNTQQLVGDKAWEFLFVLGQPGMGPVDHQSDCHLLSE